MAHSKEWVVFQQKRRALLKAMYELAEAWNEIPGKEYVDAALHYPFHRDFSELTSEVAGWVETE